MFLVSFEVCVVAEVIQVRHYGGITELVLFLKKSILKFHVNHPLLPVHKTILITI